jgi:5-bromo-4-chloroindolyl phosphate hydrolysis protein
MKYKYLEYLNAKTDKLTRRFDVTGKTDKAIRCLKHTLGTAKERAECLKKVSFSEEQLRCF